MKWINSRRKLKNVKLTKKYQMKYYGLWFVISLMLIFLLGISTFWLFEEHWRGILTESPDRTLDYVFSKSRFLATLVLISLVLLVAITCLGIMSAHRVAGPLISLHKAFEEVKNGNYSFRLKFRKEDEMAELEKMFNEMMDSLENNHSIEKT